MQNGYRAWSRQPLPTMGDSNGGSVVANITSGTFLSLCEKKRLCCLKATKKWLLIKIKCTIECSYHTIYKGILQLTLPGLDTDSSWQDTTHFSTGLVELPWSIVNEQFILLSGER